MPDHYYMQHVEYKPEVLKQEKNRMFPHQR